MENTTEFQWWWKQGFYRTEQEGGVGITAAERTALLDAQSKGAQIFTNTNGYPIAAYNAGDSDELKQLIANSTATTFIAEDKPTTELSELQSWGQEYEVTDDTITLKWVVVEPTLEEAQAAKLSELITTFDTMASAAEAGTPNGEVLTWDIQKIEAEQWSADNTADTPFLDKLAIARNIDRVALIEKVLEKVAIYRDYMATLTGTRQKYEDMVDAAVSVAEINKIKWEDF